MNKEEVFFSIDVETNGSIPGIYSMLSFGAAAFKDYTVSEARKLRRFQRGDELRQQKIIFLISLSCQITNTWLF
jgi:hypothetical protein